MGGALRGVDKVRKKTKSRCLLMMLVPLVKECSFMVRRHVTLSRSMAQTLVATI